MLRKSQMQKELAIVLTKIRENLLLMLREDSPPLQSTLAKPKKSIQTSKLSPVE
jgi:hypothetical protein